MNRIMRFFLTFAAVYMGVYLIMLPQEGAGAARGAVDLCINSVVPALLPYLICSGYLAASGFSTALGRYLAPVMKPIFNLPGSSAVALVLGCVSGYPVGAVCSADLYSSGECTKAQAERLLALSNNSGPVFIVSVVGAGYLQSPYLGRILYVSHIMAAVLAGVIMRTYNGKGTYTQRALPRPVSLSAKNTVGIFGTVVDNSVFSILKICGFVVFFTVLAASIPHTALTPYIHSLLELTGGVRALAGLDAGFQLKMSLISFFIALSGVSVLFQVGAISSKYGLSLKPYIIGKLLQGVFSAVLTNIMVRGLPETAAVFAQEVYSNFNIGESIRINCTMLGLGLLLLAGGSAVCKSFLKK